MWAPVFEAEGFSFLFSVSKCSSNILMNPRWRLLGGLKIFSKTNAEIQLILGPALRDMNDF
jgi:hypothetical protein